MAHIPRATRPKGITVKKIYKDGEVLEAADLNASLAELEEKIKAISVQKYPTPPLANGVRPGNAGFQIYKVGDLVIFQGALVVEKYLSNNNFLAGTLPEEVCPKKEVWFPCIRYNQARNLIVYPSGTFCAVSASGDSTLSPGWFELGAVKYVVESTTTPAPATIQSTSQPAATQSTETPVEES